MGRLYFTPDPESLVPLFLLSFPAARPRCGGTEEHGKNKGGMSTGESQKTKTRHFFRPAHVKSMSVCQEIIPCSHHLARATCLFAENPRSVLFVGVLMRHGVFYFQFPTSTCAYAYT